MKDSRIIIGNFFESKVMDIFELAKPENKGLVHIPDLVSKDGSYFVEVKASAYNNGGVINSRQLYGFNREINKRRFYAFVYHSVLNINKNYFSEEELIKKLDLKSMYLIPFSIVKSHFENSRLRTHIKHDSYVQLDEKQAENIFGRDETTWKILKLDINKYKMNELHKKIKLITKEGNLEQQVKNSFHPEFI